MQSRRRQRRQGRHFARLKFRLYLCGSAPYESNGNLLIFNRDEDCVNGIVNGGRGNAGCRPANGDTDLCQRISIICRRQATMATACAAPVTGDSRPATARRNGNSSSSGGQGGESLFTRRRARGLFKAGFPCRKRPWSASPCVQAGSLRKTRTRDGGGAAGRAGSAGAGRVNIRAGSGATCRASTASTLTSSAARAS